MRVISVKIRAYGRNNKVLMPFMWNLKFFLGLTCYYAGLADIYNKITVMRSRI